MGLFGLVFLIVALVLIGIGIAVGAFACLIASILVGLGVISSSFFVGILSGRPSAGVRAFLLQCGILAGIPAGAVCAWLGHNFYNAVGSELPILFFGALGGAVAGVIVALMLDFISGRFGSWAGARAQALRVTTARPVLEKRG
jgi:hypothetical protein